MAWRENLVRFPDHHPSTGLPYQAMYPSILQDPPHSFMSVMPPGRPPSGSMSSMIRPMTTLPSYPQPVLPIGATFPPSSPFLSMPSVGPSMVGTMMGPMPMGSHSRPPSSMYVSPPSMGDLQRSIIPGSDPNLMSPPMLDMFSPPPPPSMGMGGRRLQSPLPISMPLGLQSPGVRMLPPPPPLKQALPRRTPTPTLPAPTEQLSSPGIFQSTPGSVHSRLWTPPTAADFQPSNNAKSSEHCDDVVALNQSYAGGHTTGSTSVHSFFSNSETSAFSRPLGSETGHWQSPEEHSESSPDLVKLATEGILTPAEVQSGTVIKQEPGIEASEGHVDYRAAGDKYMCNRCNYSSPRIHKMLQHVRAHTGSKICNLCNKAFIKSCDLYRHMDKHSKVPKTPNAGPHQDAIRILRANLESVHSSRSKSASSNSPTGHDDFLTAKSATQNDERGDKGTAGLKRHDKLESSSPSDQNAHHGGVDEVHVSEPKTANEKQTTTKNVASNEPHSHTEVAAASQVTNDATAPNVFVQESRRRSQDRDNITRAQAGAPNTNEAHQHDSNEDPNSVTKCAEVVHNVTEPKTRGKTVNMLDATTPNSNQTTGETTVHMAYRADEASSTFETRPNSTSNGEQLATVTSVRNQILDLADNDSTGASQTVDNEKLPKDTEGQRDQHPRTVKAPQQQESNVGPSVQGQSQIEQNTRPKDVITIIDDDEEFDDYRNLAGTTDKLSKGISVLPVEKDDESSTTFRIQDVRSCAGDSQIGQNSSTLDSQDERSDSSEEDQDDSCTTPLVALPEYTSIQGNVVDLAKFNLPRYAPLPMTCNSILDEPPSLTKAFDMDQLPSDTVGKSPPRLKKQRKTQHPGDFRCALCNYEGRSEKSLQKHLRAHNQSYKICKYCGKAFERPSDLLRHEERHESNMQKHQGNPSIVSKGRVLGISGQDGQFADAPDQQTFTCKKCNFVTNRFHVLILHQRHKHSVKYRCEHCGMTFISQIPLTNHLKRCQMKVPIDSSKQPEQCMETCKSYTQTQPLETWRQNFQSQASSSMPAPNIGIPPRNWPSTTQCSPSVGLQNVNMSKVSSNNVLTSQTQSAAPAPPETPLSEKQPQSETSGIGRLDSFKKDILAETKLVEIKLEDDNEISLSLSPVKSDSEHFSASKIPCCSQYTDVHRIIDQGMERLDVANQHVSQVHSEPSRDQHCQPPKQLDQNAGPSDVVTPITSHSASVLNIQPEAINIVPRTYESPVTLPTQPRTSSVPAATNVCTAPINISPITSPSVMTVFPAIPQTRNVFYTPQAVTNPTPIITSISSAMLNRTLPVMVDEANALAQQDVLSPVIGTSLTEQSSFRVINPPFSTQQAPIMSSNSQQIATPIEHLYNRSLTKALSVKKSRSSLVQISSPLSATTCSTILQVVNPTRTSIPHQAPPQSVVIKITDAVRAPQMPTAKVVHVKRKIAELLDVAESSTKHARQIPVEGPVPQTLVRMYPDRSLESSTARPYTCTDDHNYHTSPLKAPQFNIRSETERSVDLECETSTVPQPSVVHTPTKPVKPTKSKSAETESQKTAKPIKLASAPLEEPVQIKLEPKTEAVQLMRPNVYRHKQLRHYCERCNYGTDEERKMREHLRAHEGRFVCKHCEKACIKASDLYRHWVTHNLRAPNGELICDTCDYTCPSKAGMENHLRVHYIIRLSPMAPSHNIAKCGICQKKFTRSQLFVHKRLVHNKQQHSMTSAAASLRAARGWSSHGKTAAGTSSGQASSSGGPSSTSFWCPMCDQQFATSSAINSHYETMHMDNNNIDGVITLAPGFLDEADQSDNQSSRNASEKLATTNRQTARKGRKHKWAKIHQCKFCQKRFSSRYYKTEHERLHTNEKPYACSKCGERFVLRQACYTHESKNCTVRRERVHLKADELAAYDASTDTDGSTEQRPEPENVAPPDGDTEQIADGAIDPEDLALIQSLPLPSIEIVTD